MQRFGDKSMQAKFENKYYSLRQEQSVIGGVRRQAGVTP